MSTMEVAVERQPAVTQALEQMLLIHNFDVRDAQHAIHRCYGGGGWMLIASRPRDWLVAGFDVRATRCAFDRG